MHQLHARLLRRIRRQLKDLAVERVLSRRHDRDPQRLPLRTVVASFAQEAPRGCGIRLRSREVARIIGTCGQRKAERHARVAVQQVADEHLPIEQQRQRLPDAHILQLRPAQIPLHEVDAEIGEVVDDLAVVARDAFVAGEHSVQVGQLVEVEAAVAQRRILRGSVR